MNEENTAEVKQDQPQTPPQAVLATGLGGNQPQTPAQGTTRANPLQTAVPASSKRAYSDLRRNLDETDLSSSGVQKLILDALDQAEAKCAGLEGYRDKFHAADKRVAVLEEQARARKANEVLFVSSLTFAGVLVGLAPGLWSSMPAGPIVLVIGLILGALGVSARGDKK